MKIRLADYPQLRLIAWNRGVEEIEAQEAFALYESRWRFIEPASLTPSERELIQKLTATFGRGLFNA